MALLPCCKLTPIKVTNTMPDTIWRHDKTRSEETCMYERRISRNECLEQGSRIMAKEYGKEWKEMRGEGRKGEMHCLLHYYMNQ